MTISVIANAYKSFYSKFYFNYTPCILEFNYRYGNKKEYVPFMS